MKVLWDDGIKRLQNLSIIHYIVNSSSSCLEKNNRLLAQVLN